MARTEATESWDSFTPAHDEILGVERGKLILSSDPIPGPNDGTSWSVGEKAPLVAGLTYSFRAAAGMTAAFDRLRVS